MAQFCPVRKVEGMEIIDIISSCGFEHTGTCAASELAVREEVRAMCAADKCHAYGHNWSCPPACGDLAFWQETISQKSTCYLVQTVGELEDEYDFEGIMDAEAVHKKRLYQLLAALRDEHPEAIILAAGTCSLCKPCAYPDEPCRHPEKMMVSMEAAGLVVSDTCKAAGMSYYYGKSSTSFTSCVLV